MYRRYLQTRLPSRSFFLFGPRQVGKTTLLKGLKTILSVNLLDPDEQLAFNKSPNLLIERLYAASMKGTVLIDEIQKVPKLLDVVHSLMEENRELRFVMSGSSARKLRRGASANLLGGRALYRTLHPLTFEELGQSFDLRKALSYGTLPKICSCLDEGDEDGARDLLRAYVTTYIREEIKEEAIVRNLHGFQNFLDVAARQFAEKVNLSSVGRDCHVAYTTVREYYSILEDTLIGFFLRPFSGSERKRMSLSPKFYFFDCGVTRALLGTMHDMPGPLETGRLFEQWFIQEVVRLNEYMQKDFRLSFWRTSHGAEVDLVIERGGKVFCAVEIKYRQNVSRSDTTGISSFRDSHPEVPCYLTAPVKMPLKLGDILVVRPEEMLEILKGL